jgi:hypothetical protein
MFVDIAGPCAVHTLLVLQDPALFTHFVIIAEPCSVPSCLLVLQDPVVFTHIVGIARGCVILWPSHILSPVTGSLHEAHDMNA